MDSDRPSDPLEVKGSALTSVKTIDIANVEVTKRKYANELLLMTGFRLINPASDYRLAS